MVNSKENTLEVSSELDHLIKLLDDEDENIYSNIKERFIFHGDDTALFLKKFLNDENKLIKKRAGEIITAINFDSIRQKFIKTVNSDEDQILEKLMFLLSEFADPEIKKEYYVSYLNKLADKIKSELSIVNPDVNSINPEVLLIKVINYLVETEKYKANDSDHPNADHFYLHKVIDNKSGSYETLSVIYILILRRLRIPVFGVNLPGYSILKYKKDNDEYFIDPFKNNSVISKKFLSEYAESQGLNSEEMKKYAYLDISGDKEIFLRVLRNISEIYNAQNDMIKVQQIENIMLCLA